MKTKSKGMKLIIVLSLHLFSGMILHAQSGNWTDAGTYLMKQMNDWNIPGMAVIVIRNDSVLLKSTLGYSEIKSKKTVGPKTLFSIGSCTKGFTSTAMLMLQDSNKVNLEKNVIDYYPELVLSDTFVRNQLTIKDILSHRTGFERGDYIWYGSSFSREEILLRLKYLEHVAPLRNNFIYNNMLYTLAGLIIEKASGMRYEDFVRENIVEPLHMKHTFYGLPAGEKDYALPYLFIGNQQKELPLPNLKGVEPAGGIWSDLDDMSIWLKFLMNRGKADTLQLLSKKSARALQTPLVFTGGGMRADETEFKSYGLGFGFTAYRGKRVMYHTGVSGGYIAHIALMPEENTGIVLLANTETFTNGIINNLFDRALGTEQTDWSTDVLKIVNEQRAESEQEREDALLQIKNRKAAPSNKTFAGVFMHPACREIEIICKDNLLSLKYNNMIYPLVAGAENTFWAYDEINFGKMELVYSVDGQKNITGLVFKLMGEELIFTKKN